MSTKIYYAYRCPIKDFAKTFLPTFRESCFKNAAQKIRKWMKDVTEQELKANVGKYPPKDAKYARLQYVLEKAAESSVKLERDLYCIDSSVNVWLYNNKAYIIPYGEYWLREGYNPEGVVEDYCYYNNTDRPDNVTERQWEARSNTWDKVCLDDWDSNRLVHQIIQADKQIGTYEIAKRIISAHRARTVIYF